MASAQSHQASSTASCQVVVADDNHDAADSLALLINTLGYPARAVYDGREAVAACKALSPHLMICDIEMPLADGLEAARRIRANDHRPDLKLVALSALSGELHRRECSAAGFDRHFVKPIGIDQLRGLLASYLGSAVPASGLSR